MEILKLVAIFLLVGAAGLLLINSYKYTKDGKPRNEDGFALSAEDLGLICRALSDSMNYKPNDRRSEKWALLLECKRHQRHLENEAKERENG